MRPKSFFINGGAGRVICSIPAFEKYQEENPDEDFLIICEGGTDFFKGHPTLYGKVYDNWHKNLFRDKLIDTDVKTPEPYRVWEYYNQKCSLAQAFDIEINGKGIRELPKPTIQLTKEETVNGKFIVEEVRLKTGKRKTVVFQPFGRGVQTAGNIIGDSSGRSFELQNVISIIKRLQKKYSVIVMAEIGIDFEKEGVRDIVSFPAANNVPARAWASIINEADLFLGCDSMGQHLAYCSDTPAVTVMGSTYGINVSYPEEEKFDVLDMGEGKRIYDPIRITMDEESARANDGIMMMNDKIEEVIMKSVDKLMNKYYQKPLTQIVLPQEWLGEQGCPVDSKPAAKKPKVTPFELEASNNDVTIPALEPTKKGFSQNSKII